MSDKTTKKATNQTASKTEKKDEGSRVEKSRDSAPKRERIVWTLERCMKYARRYTSEALWASGSSASYKSAVAHGWKDACVAEIHRTQSNGGKVIAGNFKKTPPDTKKAA